MSESENAAAWADLELAIETFLSRTGEPGLLMDWTLVHFKIQPGEDGSDRHTTGVTGAERQPSYRALGLLEYGAAAIRANAIASDEDD